MPEPFLDLGNVGLVRKRVGCRCRAHRVDTIHFGMNARLAAIFHDDVAVDGAGIEMLIGRSCPVISHGAEEGSIHLQIARRPSLFSALRSIPQ